MCRIEPAHRRVLILGVGYRASPDTVLETNIYETSGIKPNLGAASALQIARAGYHVVLAAKTARKLERVRESILHYIPQADILTHPVDILNRESVTNLCRSMPDDLEIDLVQSAGLSAGGYILPDDNPYLPVQDIPPDLPTIEFDVVVRGLLNVVQAFLPKWRAQSETRFVVIASMSGIRAYPLGYAHASAKAGLHHAVRSLTLEVTKHRIYVSEVNPGIADTGLYDPPAVRAAVTNIGLEFGYDYRGSELPQMPPIAIADAVVLCLTSPAHILSIDAVAQGQFPHHGA